MLRSFFYSMVMAAANIWLKTLFPAYIKLLNGCICFVRTFMQIMLAEGEEEQDRVTLNATKIGSKGRLDVEEQAEVNKAVEDWWHCSREAKASRNRWDSSGGDHGRRGAVGAGDNFYQTTTTGTST